jgi:hypothetical protein
VASLLVEFFPYTLEERGLAVRSYDPADWCRVLIEPTQRADELSHELFADLLGRIREFPASYSEAEL